MSHNAASQPYRIVDCNRKSRRKNLYIEIRKCRKTVKFQWSFCRLHFLRVSFVDSIILFIWNRKIANCYTKQSLLCNFSSLNCTKVTLLVVDSIKQAFFSISALLVYGKLRLQIVYDAWLVHYTDTCTLSSHIHRLN